MKNLSSILFLCLSFSLFAQIHELQTQHFEKFIQVERVSSKEVNIHLLTESYVAKKSFITFLEANFCNVGSLQKLLFIDQKTSNIKSFTVDTSHFVSINLIFSKRLSLKKSQKVIDYFQLLMKQHLMNWQEFVVNNQSVYFIGHRGGVMQHFQENTNKILWAGKELGLSYFEIDVLSTHDSIPFLAHDWEYIYDQLKLMPKNDSIEVSKTFYKDGQKVLFLSTCIHNNKYLILDLVHNRIEDQKKIITYLHKYFQKKFYLRFIFKLINMLCTSIYITLILRF